MTPMPPDRGELGFGERARLALERDLLGRRSTDDVAVSRLHEASRAAGRQERRRAAAEIDEVERPPRDGRPLGVELPLARRADRGTARPPWRSCRCRPGSNRNGSASGRTGCAGTAPAGRRGAGEASATLALGTTPPRRSRPKTAGNSRRNSCRPRFARDRPPATSRPCLDHTGWPGLSLTGG